MDVQMQASDDDKQENHDNLIVIVAPGGFLFLGVEQSP